MFSIISGTTSGTAAVAISGLLLEGIVEGGDGVLPVRRHGPADHSRSTGRRVLPCFLSRNEI